MRGARIHDFLVPIKHFFHIGITVLSSKYKCWHSDICASLAPFHRSKIWKKLDSMISQLAIEQMMKRCYLAVTNIFIFCFCFFSLFLVVLFSSSAFVGPLWSRARITTGQNNGRNGRGGKEGKNRDDCFLHSLLWNCQPAATGSLFAFPFLTSSRADF